MHPYSPRFASELVNSLLPVIKYLTKDAGEIAQWLGVLTILTEALGSVPNAHITACCYL